ASRDERSDRGVLKSSRAGCQNRAPADDRLTPLELLDCQIDTLAEEAVQGRVESIVGDQLSEVALFTTGQAQQRTVGIARLGVDRAVGEIEEVDLALLETIAQHSPRFGFADRTTKMRRQASQESRADDHVVE